MTNSFKTKETSPSERVQSNGDGLRRVPPPPRVAKQHFAIVVVTVQAHDLYQTGFGVGPVQVAWHPVNSHSRRHAHHSSRDKLRGISTIHLNAPQATLVVQKMTSFFTFVFFEAKRKNNNFFSEHAHTDTERHTHTCMQLENLILKDTKAFKKNMMCFVVVLLLCCCCCRWSHHCFCIFAVVFYWQNKNKNKFC